MPVPITEKPAEPLVVLISSLYLVPVGFPFTPHARSASMIAQLSARTDVVPGLKDNLEELNGVRRQMMEAQQTDDGTWIRSRINGILGDLVTLTIALDRLSGVFPRT
jgi:hypothetical protein